MACHPEPSQVMRKAHGLAQSKDPYTACITDAPVRRCAYLAKIQPCAK